MHRFASYLAAAGALADGVTAEQARDLLWTLNSVDLYELLVERRAWSPPDYGRFLAARMAAALLDGAGVA